MSNGLTAQEQHEYTEVCREAEFHHLLMTAIRKEQGLFEDHYSRIKDYIAGLNKLLAAYNKDKRWYENKMLAYQQQELQQQKQQQEKSTEPSKETFN